MILFCHANGFPPGSYQELFNLIDDQIQSIPLSPLKRPFTKEENKNNWHHFGDELIEDLQNHPQLGNLIGVGHSMGGILLLRAAALYPHWFKKIILIDPTLLPEHFVWLSNYLPQFINRKIHPVASKAFQRRDHWPSKQIAFDSFRQKKLFKYISDEGLWNYIHSVMTELPNGEITLGYSKAWEEHCFLKVINAWPFLRACQTPIVGINGYYSELIRPKIIQRWKKLDPISEIHRIEKAGHLVPLERPKEVATIINQVIEQF